MRDHRTPCRLSRRCSIGGIAKAARSKDFQDRSAHSTAGLHPPSFEPYAVRVRSESQKKNDVRAASSMRAAQLWPCGHRAATCLPRGLMASGITTRWHCCHACSIKWADLNCKEEDVTEKKLA